MKKVALFVLIATLFTSCVYVRPITSDDYRKVTPANLVALGIPGLVQILNGEYLKGALFYVGTALPAVVAAGVFGTAEGGVRPGLEVPFFLTAGIGGLSYMWSFVDGVGTTLKYSQQSRMLEIERSNFTEQEKYAISKRSIFIGMSADAAIAAIGKPTKVNKTVGSWGTHEQWVYSTNVYVYIENGFVSSWQK